MSKARSTALEYMIIDAKTEETLMIGTVKECADFIGVKKRAIYVNVSRGLKHAGRHRNYRIEPTGTPEYDVFDKNGLFFSGTIKEIHELTNISFSSLYKMARLGQECKGIRLERA